tara:strand:- start:296 stop:2875 length:2580 start_codon:yes stop_codon:yes gene_type:complete
MLGAYQRKKEDVVRDLSSRNKGLTQAEINDRLVKYGPNILKEKKKRSPLILFLRQFTSFLVLILIFATVVSFLLGERIDALVIGIIVVLNGVFGFVQEFKAEKAIEALKKMGSLKCKVIRNGKTETIDASKVVPGDILVLGEGDKVAADARLLDVNNLLVDESLLTGESAPVEKVDKIISKKVAVSERHNMVFSNTIVTRGKGLAVVVKTGMETEVGRIAELIQEEKVEMTPLQKKLQKFGKFLGIIFLFMCAVIFLIGVLKGNSIVDMFLVAVSLAVAAIPEGLPAVVTISLALGVQRMVKRNVLIRKLSSVETLGSTDVICADKTGTLTCNEMTVKKVYFDDKLIDVAGTGYDVEGGFFVNKKKYNSDYLEMLLRVCASCNDATVEDGDPTERALMVLAAKGGFSKEKRIGEVPFNSESKYMSTKHLIKGKEFSFIKGAPEVVLGMCSDYYSNRRVVRLTPKAKKEILEVNSSMASGALRVLGMAYKTGARTVFVGLAGMIDPPRKEVKLSIEKCKSAGIRVVMITGDHKLTALSVAKELGITGEALVGEELDKLSEKEFLKVIEKVNVYARVSPEHKSKILDGLEKKGHIVAMTGDGVNDAPALKKAHIGVAMGVKGTDVAKEASEMILTDDNFVSIVNAVEEGRGIYDNITKFVDYMLSSNLGEVLVIFLAMLIGFSVNGGIVLPLLAIQILWMNLVTDGLPAIALGVDPINKKVMQRKPRDINEGIITKKMMWNIGLIGILIALSTLFLFWRFLPNLVLAQTVAFTTLIVLQIVRVQMVRKQHNEKLFSNKWLNYALISSIGLQLLVIYTPLSNIFHTTALGVLEWVWIIGVALIVFALGSFGSKVIKDRFVEG